MWEINVTLRLQYEMKQLVLFYCCKKCGVGDSLGGKFWVIEVQKRKKYIMGVDFLGKYKWGQLIKAP